MGDENEDLARLGRYEAFRCDVVAELASTEGQLRDLMLITTVPPPFFLAFPRDELADDLADMLLGDDHALDADQVRRFEHLVLLF